jgi:hypothetical protein
VPVDVETPPLVVPPVAAPLPALPLEEDEVVVVGTVPVAPAVVPVDPLLGPLLHADARSCRQAMVIS